MHEYTTEQVDKMRQNLAEAELDTRLARQDIEGDKPEAYEAAAAAEAKTGMGFQKKTFCVKISNFPSQNPCAGHKNPHFAIKKNT